MADRFALYADAVSAPSRSQRAVTPNDTTDLPDGACKALHAVGAGSIVTIGVDDTAAVTHYIVQGGMLPIRARRVLSTGTTATGIVALY
jgi:hypothetical protein